MMPINMPLLFILLTASVLCCTNGFSISMPSHPTSTTTIRGTTLLQALPSSNKGPSDRSKSVFLSATTTLTNTRPETSSSSSSTFSEELNSIKSIIEAALLVTGSTVGASCLVLPDTVAGPGMLACLPMFGVAYAFNLISGLVLAEVAIQQYESNGSQVPSSFAEFGSETLGPETGRAISALSVLVNTCVVSFDLVRAGTVLGNELLPLGDTAISHETMSVLFATVIAGLVATRSSKELSSIASMAVLLLFASFAALLLPGMAHVVQHHAVMSTLLTPGTSTTNNMQACLHAFPILLLTCVYQNIVPSVTKILNYQRTQVTAALTLGSLLPLIMYIAWSWTVLGGGMDTSSLVGGPLLQVFSIAAVTGSALGCTMSIAEEVDTVILESKQETILQDVNKKGFNLSSVLLSVSVPLAAGLLFAGGKDFDAALSVAGTYGDPLLYGVIPACMAYTQRQASGENKNSLVPSSLLNVLGVGSMLFLGQELVEDVSSILS